MPAPAAGEERGVVMLHLLLGLGTGLLLGRMLQLPGTAAERLVSGGGVAGVLGAGGWLLLERGLDNLAVGVLAGVLLAVGSGLTGGLGSGLGAAYPPGRRPALGPFGAFGTAGPSGGLNSIEGSGGSGRRSAGPHPWG